MRSFLAGLRRLVIPWGATADQPRVVIATDDPLARAFADAAVAYYYTGGRGFVTWVAPTGPTGGVWGISAGPADTAQFAERVDFVRAEYGGDATPLDDAVTVGADQRSGRAAHMRFWHDLDGLGGLVGVVEIHGDRVDVTGPTTITGDLTVTGTINGGGGGADPVESAEDATNFGSISNTSPAVGSPVCGTAFVAPASGKVFITVGGVMTQVTTGSETVIGFHVKTGGTLNAGTDVVVPVAENGIRTGRAAVASAAMSRRKLISGLTPGDTYNVVAKHWVTSGTGSIEHREIIVEPINA